MDDFLTGREKVSGKKMPENTVVPTATNQKISNIEAIETGEGEPKVELETKNGQIQKIIVTCSCGKRVELKCHC